MKEREEVVRGFAAVINRHCLENESNTPDFILAEYLMDALETYERIHNANEKWYGRKLEIGTTAGMNVPTFEQLMSNDYLRCDTERVLCQCIAALSTQLGYENLTPWEVYDEMVKQTEGLYENEPEEPLPGFANVKGIFNDEEIGGSE